MGRDGREDRKSYRVLGGAAFIGTLFSFVIRGAFVRMAKLGDFCFKTWDLGFSARDLAFGTERHRRQLDSWDGWMVHYGMDLPL